MGQINLIFAFLQEKHPLQYIQGWDCTLIIIKYPELSTVFGIGIEDKSGKIDGSK